MREVQTASDLDDKAIHYKLFFALVMQGAQIWFDNHRMIPGQYLV